MVTRREIVLTGALGSLSTAAAAPESARGQPGDAASAEAMRSIQQELAQIRAILDDGLRQHSLNFGVVVPIRRQFETFLRANTKYPDYCEIGVSVFTEIYDWHVKHNQPLQVSRVDNRTAIRFMFTWMILIPTQDPFYIGIPFDRG
jgi:hypothetical protein